MHLPDPILLATPGFLILLAVDMFYARRFAREDYEPRDIAASLAMGAGSVVLGLLFGFVTIDIANYLARFRAFNIEWSWGMIALCFVLDDLTFYWWHRTSHRVRWMWAHHVQHHSSQYFNIATAFRQTWTVLGLASFAFRLPMVILGFPPEMIIFAHSANLVGQFWIHTERIGKMPNWFEAIMNTPSHHRVHHATNASYLDRNFAGVFIVWDRLFGTFVEEQSSEPLRYGIVHNLGTFNPIKIAIHEWIDIGRDVTSAPTWRDRFGYLFGPPGWSPDGSRETSESIRQKWSAVGEPLKKQTTRPVSKLEESNK